MTHESAMLVTGTAATAAASAAPAVLDSTVARELAAAWPVGVVLLAVVVAFLWAILELNKRGERQAAAFLAALERQGGKLDARVAECHAVQEKTHAVIERAAQAHGEAAGTTARAVIVLERIERRLDSGRLGG